MNTYHNLPHFSGRYCGRLKKQAGCLKNRLLFYAKNARKVRTRMFHAKNVAKNPTFRATACGTKSLSFATTTLPPLGGVGGKWDFKKHEHLKS